MDSLYFVGLYLILGTGDNNNIFKRIYISAQAFVKGVSKISNLLTQYLEWDYAFFYDKSSKEIFKSEFHGLLKNFKITGTLDEETFKYDINGESIYVSQPFHKSGYVSEKGYLKYLKRLFKVNDNLFFLLHPKIDYDWVTEFLDHSKIITKRDLINRIKTKKVIGHFSSILLGIDDRIELKIDNIIDNVNLPECKIFNPYVKIEFNGLEKIRMQLDA